jgi:hypothetical protein
MRVARAAGWLAVVGRKWGQEEREHATLYPAGPGRELDAKASKGVIGEGGEGRAPVKGREPHQR